MTTSPSCHTETATTCQAVTTFWYVYRLRRRCRAAEDCGLRIPQGQELRQVRPNHELLGKLVEIRGKGFRFSPRCWHGTEAWEGRRVVLNGHSTAGARKLSQSELSQLVDMGFPLPLELSWHANFQPTVENVATSEESGSPKGTAENITTTNQDQQHTPQNSVSNSLPLSQTSGHCEFWKDVCEAQTGSDDL